MRSVAIICAGLALVSSVAPTRAQYAPFGGAPGMWVAPELANGALGAGAANNAAAQTYCSNVGVGRDGPRGQCPQTPSADPNRPHR